MSGKLSEKTCIPCRGGIPPLGLDAAEELAEQTPGWNLIESGKKISRRFTFDDFKSPMGLVQEIGELAEREGHHPDIEFGWGYCRVTIFTHKINGLHENDFILAAKINQLSGPEPSSD